MNRRALEIGERLLSKKNFKFVVHHVNKEWDWDNEKAKWMWTKVLLVKRVGEKGMIKLPMTWSAMEVCLGRLTGLMLLQWGASQFSQALLLPDTSGRYFLKGSRCSPQTKHEKLHNDNASYSALLWCCMGKTAYPFDCFWGPKGLSTTSGWEEVTWYIFEDGESCDFQALCVWGLGLVQPAGAVWKADRALRYHWNVVQNGPSRG